MTHFIETSTISVDSALELVRLGIAHGAEAGVKAVVTVIDPSLLQVAMGKADGSTPHSIETSKRKAQSSASTRRATGWMDTDFAVQGPLGTGMLLTNILGGMPIVFDGRHVGGLGIAGGSPAQDAAIAAAVLELIGADQP